MVKFIPFPHKSLGSDVNCSWETRYINDTKNYDAIQLAAFAEGICTPHNNSTTIHVFSTEEAIECLSSTKQGRNISVTVSGDSYTRQLFIGFSVSHIISEWFALLWIL